MGFTGNEHSHSKRGRWGVNLVLLRAVHHSISWRKEPQREKKRGFVQKQLPELEAFLGHVHGSPVVFQHLNCMIYSDDRDIKKCAVKYCFGMSVYN